MSMDHTGSHDLMDFPRIQFPNFFKMLRSKFLIHFVILPYLDQNFSIKNFLDGAKEAALVVSDRLASGDMDALRDLVTPEALTEIQANYARMSVRERCDLRLDRRAISPIVIPYELGMIIEEDEDVQKRWVEITVIFHVHRKLMDDDGNLSTSAYMHPDFTVCNYRFIRNFTKGVSDSWTVNVVNHFKPNLRRDE